jgi:hypothetical protein
MQQGTVGMQQAFNNREFGVHALISGSNGGFTLILKLCDFTPGTKPPFALGLCRCLVYGN